VRNKPDKKGERRLLKFEGEGDGLAEVEGDELAEGGDELVEGEEDGLAEEEAISCDEEYTLEDV
jgi:hypothetical protein